MKERFKLRLVEKVISGLPALATPPQIAAEIKRFDDGVAAIAALGVYQPLSVFLPETRHTALMGQ
jgi:hypothetical protein